MSKTSPSVTPDSRLVIESQHVPFVGLTDSDQTDVEVPDTARSKLDIGDDPDTFRDVINLLPDAAYGDLRAVNQFVNDDGSLDIDHLSTVDIDIGKAADVLGVDPDAITDADKYEHLENRKLIVDTRREALSALGFDVSYSWQVASDGYAIVPPKDIYNPAADTFAQYNEGADIFGWVSIRDYGGTVDLYILFADEYVQTPSDYDADLYLGYNSGYDYKGHKKLYVNHFGYCPRGEGLGSLLYGLGTSHSRKHLGTPTDKAHERSNDRLPIQEWWNTGHKAFLNDNSVERDIATAESMTVDFDSYPFDHYGFYRHLDIPPTHAEAAVARLNAQTADRDSTMWDLGFALILSLASSFNGDKAGPTFRARIKVGTDLIQQPQTPFKEALRNHRENGPPDADDDIAESRSDVDINALLSDIETPDDLTTLEGINVEDLSTTDKARVVERVEQAKLKTF